MTPRCMEGYSKYETVNGKPRHMQCRKHGKVVVAIRHFLGTRITGMGYEPAYFTRNEWRCADHAPEAAAKAVAESRVSAALTAYVRQEVS